MLCSQYFRNTFAINPKQQVVTNGQKNNFSDMFKLELASKNLPLRLCCVSVVIKMFWTQHFQKLPKQINQPKSPNQTFNCVFLNCVFKWHILKLLFFFQKNDHFLNSQSVSACFNLQLNLLDLCDTFFKKGNAFCLYCYLFRQYVGN